MPRGLKLVTAGQPRGAGPQELGHVVEPPVGVERHHVRVCILYAARHSAVCLYKRSILGCIKKKIRVATSY